MNDYKLTFTVTFNAQDDPAARKQAKNIVKAIDKTVFDANAKLQEIFTDKPPRGIRID